jgi:hypothetical protein
MHRTVVLLALVLLLVSAVFVLGQDAEPESLLEITVSRETCPMEVLRIADAPADAEDIADAPSLVLGLAPSEECDEVRGTLYVASNDVLWISLATPGEFLWQQFTAVEDDENPPRFDKRGRYVGCLNSEEGEQTCRLLWDYERVVYLIELPIRVGDAYFKPTVEPVSTEPVVISTPNSGVWGDCGSCTTCGGPVEHCVLAPDNACLWDAERCEPKGN